MRPPLGFVADLARFDPDLRVRWGPHSHQWFIEIKCRERMPDYLGERPNPLGTSPRARDLWEGWLEGYLHVLSVPRELLAWDLVASYLKMYRVQSHAEARRLSDRLDELDAQWEASIDRQTDTLAEAFGHDLYDQFAWDQKRRISTFVPAVTEEAHDGFIVRDRRVSLG
jgi:hypothetical protein